VTDAVPGLPGLPDLFRLDGRVAVVTGASSGLGARFARVLHGAGARVVLAARRLDRLEQLAAELPDSLPVACDVGRPEDVEQLVERTLDVTGRVDVLVNNAGTDAVGPAEQQVLDDFRRVIDVNLVGLFHLTQLAARPMLARGSGVVVNVASILGLVSAAPIPNAAYCASKGAVVNLTRELAVQWARKGVRVNALAPGWFETEMTQEMFADDKGMAFLERNAPMARGGREHELDGALLFLASDASSYVTGHTLVVDGGWTAR
jgi:NAD(P)-dependent dehydrogenase (short-subunit alcohol dehydrogenase family)